MGETKKPFKVTYESKGLIYYHFKGIEIIHAENLATAHKIAENHAQQAGWSIQTIVDVEYWQLKKEVS